MNSASGTKAASAAFVNARWFTGASFTCTRTARTTASGFSLEKARPQERLAEGTNSG